MQDDSIKEIVSKNDYKITFNTKFQLNIKCLSEEQAAESAL
jgi:hypothetical protein